MSALDFSIFIVAMFWSAVGIFALAIGLLILLLLARLRAIGRKRHIAALVAHWRGIFAGTATKARAKIRAQDAFTVLGLWNDFCRVRAGDDPEGAERTEALVRVARVHHLDTVALDLLRRGDTGDRIIALTFAGYTRLGRALRQAKALSGSPDGDLSLMAFRAATLIDPTEIEPFVRAVSVRADWRLRTIERVLIELGAERISAPMAAVAETASDEEAARLIRFFPLCERGTARALLREQVVGRSDPDVLAASLKALVPFVLPIDHDLISPLLRHPTSFVRIAAIEALAPICTGHDRDAFLELVTDEDSWVRYRAAEVLVAHFTDTAHEGSLRRDIADKFAQDALSQVLAERSLVVQPHPEDQAVGTQGPRRRRRRSMMDVMRTGV